MVEQKTLQAYERSKTGKGPAGRMRDEGWIPAVIYGREHDSRPLRVQERELDALLDEISVDNTLIDLEVEGEDEAHPVLIREVQRHPWKRNVQHVDFFRIKEDEAIRVEVPVRLVGTPEGVREEDGILQQLRHEIEVECLPSEIPEYFEADVTDLDIGESLHVGDLNTGSVKPLDDLDLTLCTVVPPSIVEVEEPGEAEEEAELEEMEPEVIGEAEEEEAELAEGEEPAEGEEAETEVRPEEEL
ncbi:MAG: 50S ribosomal protein L25 [Gemmatimonadota bacterium]